MELYETIVISGGMFMKHLFIFIYFLSFLSSGGAIILNVALYYKDKHKVFKESLIYNTGLFFLVFSVFLSEYVINFLYIPKPPWFLDTFKNICTITYILIIFRMCFIINKKEMGKKYFKFSVFLFFYYIILWQIIHLFKENYSLYYKILFFITLASEYILINVFPLACFAIMLKKINKVKKLVYRKYISFVAIISILMFILIPVYKIFTTVNNNFHFIVGDILACYLIIHMAALIYFGIKYFFVENIEELEKLENKIEMTIFENKNEIEIETPVKIKVLEDYNLSPREKEIIEELKLGLSNTEIAEKLFITENTVKKHIYNVYAKVEVNSRYKLLNIFK